MNGIVLGIFHLNSKISMVALVLAASVLAMGGELWQFVHFSKVKFLTAGNVLKWLRMAEFRHNMLLAIPHIMFYTGLYQFHQPLARMNAAELWFLQQKRTNSGAVAMSVVRRS